MGGRLAEWLNTDKNDDQWPKPSHQERRPVHSQWDIYIWVKMIMMINLSIIKTFSTENLRTKGVTQVLLFEIG